MVHEQPGQSRDHQMDDEAGVVEIRMRERHRDADTQSSHSELSQRANAASPDEDTSSTGRRIGTKGNDNDMPFKSKEMRRDLVICMSQGWPAQPTDNAW